jgi:hypothetical protein
MPIIVFINKYLSEDDTIELEIAAIKQIGRTTDPTNLGPLLNRTNGGDGLSLKNQPNKDQLLSYLHSKPGNRKGAKLSQDTIAKIVKSKTGKKLGPATEERKRKISLAKKGLTFSKEHKQNLSKAKKTRIITEKTKQKLKNTSTGKINIKQYKLIDPNGKIYITTNGLKQFCREHNLNSSILHKVKKGERKHNKGWKCELIE